MYKKNISELLLPSTSKAIPQKANLGLVCIIFHNDRLGNLDITLVSFIMKMIGVGYFKLFSLMV